MASTSTSDAALKLEIAKLTGAINQHRSNPIPPSRYPNTHRVNTYVNPTYTQPSSSYVRPGYTTAQKARPEPVRTTPGPGASQTRDVTIGGVAFETSQRSLVRKEIASARPAPPPRPPRPARLQQDFSRTKNGHLLKASRVYKPRSSRHQNMTLNNRRRQFQPRRLKKIDKPCPAFNTTGSCTRGLTCPYKHDASKIAICWPFLQGNCPHTADTCALSHDPTPERTPLCVHFANHGRCTRVACPFPHIHVSPRTGVCRDFAVLGYCERGIECEHQHVRECPDFAENGACPNKRCKLPHVIRANRVRKTVTAPAVVSSNSKSDDDLAPTTTPSSGSSTDSAVSVENAQLGDEFISLTFNESESEQESEEQEGSEEEEDDDDGDSGDDDDTPYANLEDRP